MVLETLMWTNAVQLYLYIWSRNSLLIGQSGQKIAWFSQVLRHSLSNSLNLVLVLVIRVREEYT